MPDAMAESLIWTKVSYLIDAGGGRLVEATVVSCTLEAWEDSAESCEAGWDVTRRGDRVLAGRVDG